MSKYSSVLKGEQVFAAQPTLDARRSGAVVAAMFIHEDTARYAYEIYVETGCQQGQSERNWLQAEQELTNRQNGPQAGCDATHQDPARDPAIH